MIRTSILTALCVILIGFGVPALSIYFSVFYDFNYIVAGIIAGLALLVAGILAIIGMAIGSDSVSDMISPSEREKLNTLRAQQRATLEELDDVVAILKEIKDVLKAAEE
jgi:hypothetical protein